MWKRRRRLGRGCAYSSRHTAGIVGAFLGPTLSNPFYLYVDELFYSDCRKYGRAMIRSRIPTLASSLIVAT